MGLRQEIRIFAQYAEIKQVKKNRKGGTMGGLHTNKPLPHTGPAGLSSTSSELYSPARLYAFQRNNRRSVFRR